jgi:hypothetical protein
MTEVKIGGVPLGIVKGGTTSFRYDQEMKKKAAEAEARRNAEEERFQAAREGVQGTEEGLVAARLGNYSMVNNTTPRLVLFYMNKDGSIRQECKSEITMLPDPLGGPLDMMFALVCPKCLERGLPQGECQIMVRNSHRKFWLDTTKAGVIVLRDPFAGVPDPVIVSGTVTVEDRVKCSNYNCTWSVKIDNSKVWEA